MLLTVSSPAVLSEWIDTAVWIIFLSAGGYAITGLIALLVIRVKEQGMTFVAAWDLSTVYVCMCMIVALLVAHSIWDQEHAEHFPKHVTYAIALTSFILMGRSSYRLHRTRADWMR